MKPATLSRIVGFGFLVGAAVSIYQGKFGVAESEMVITRLLTQSRHSNGFEFGPSSA